MPLPLPPPEVSDSGIEDTSDFHQPTDSTAGQGGSENLFNDIESDASKFGSAERLTPAALDATQDSSSSANQYLPTVSYT